MTLLPGAIAAGGGLLCLLLAIRPGARRPAHPAKLRQLREHGGPLGLLWPLAMTVGASLPSRVRPPAALLRQAGIEDGAAAAQLTGLRMLAAAAAAIVVLSIALAGTGLVALLLPAAAYGGYLAPLFWLRARARARRRRVLTELPDFIGLLKAFVNSGVALEPALQMLCAQLVRAPQGHVLAGSLGVAMAGYGLGEPLIPALEAAAARLGVDEVGLLVSAVAQGRRLGLGMETILREQELLARLDRRNAATAAASQVTNRLMAVLVGLYLPEFLCLVLVPLFWGIMTRTFG